MIIALGVTVEGEKIPLGFVQAATENERVCRQFIQSLINRDLSYHKGLLCLIDGSKGLYAALTKALSGYVVIQRCQWHKRENVMSYLPKNKQDEIKKLLQHAYDLSTYKEAKAALDAINSMVAQITRNVKRWTNSNQRSRWLATALLDIQPRLRRVKTPPLFQLNIGLDHKHLELYTCHQTADSR